MENFKIKIRLNIIGLKLYFLRVLLKIIPSRFHKSLYLHRLCEYIAMSIDKVIMILELETLTPTGDTNMNKGQITIDNKTENTQVVEYYNYVIGVYNKYNNLTIVE